jgi:glucoamylase
MCSHGSDTTPGIRDAAITMSTLVDLYAEDPSSYLSSHLVPILESYASLSHLIQHTPNPSGTFEDLSGLGEPKFHVDGSPFTGSWGRPQRDGSALRALTLMAYIRAYNASHPELWDSKNAPNPFADLYDAKMPANSTIKADLEYVSHHWQESGFDIWEEVEGLHFFTAMVQLRALREGSELATAFGDYGAARWYHSQADKMAGFIPKFWDSRKGHLVETLRSSRSGLDCGLLLGAIHGTSASDPSAQYAPYSDEILVSLLELVRDQRHRFPINTAPAPPISEDDYEFDQLAGVGVGRYPEDEYDGYGVKPSGGNPWFLCTSSVSEVLYRTSSHLSSMRLLNVTAVGLPFWRALLPSSDFSACEKSYCVYKGDDEVFENAIKRLKSVGDAFLAVVRRHADGEGSLSEQFDRVTGYERGALDLTWSYGAFLHVVMARKEVMK